ncbi:hypothetical protein ACKWTF_014868 [Chironomus riparius]
MSKCIKISQYDFANLLLDYGFDEDAKSEENVYCAKFNLQKLVSDSKIAKISVIKPEIENRCEYYSIISVYPFTSTIQMYQVLVGELQDTTCGSISQQFMKILAYKSLLIAVEKDQELKKIEIEELYANVEEKLSQFADCVLQRVKLNII